MVKIIQQWQTFGKVHPALLHDDVYKSVKDYGITSLQSYVYWAEIEKEENELDFAVYDEVVERLIKHGLKWCPFLMLGPNYSVPQWFHNSEKPVYAKCIEHNRECDVQSIWNPFILNYVERFIDLFSERYSRHGLIESILLGVSGVWGEAIYPSSEGVYRKGHRHGGWWCNDEYAKKDFITVCEKSHGSLDELNKNWGTNFNEFSSITFPVKSNHIAIDIFFKILRRIWRKTLHEDNYFYDWLERFYERGFITQTFRTDEDKNRYLFFVRWYIDSMTHYAERWIRIAKKYLSELPIYLVAGGYGDPISGADFVKQVQMCSKNDCGLRITNLVGTYAQSFVNKGLVSTAAKHYGINIQTEEIVETAPDEVNVRIFDYSTGNIDGLYFKTLFGIDYGTVVSCTGKSDNNLPIGKPSKVAEKLLQNTKNLISGERKVDVALFISNSSFLMYPYLLHLNFKIGKGLRSFFDLDIIDGNLIGDDILKNYRFCISFNNPVMDNNVFAKIKGWISGGGIFINSYYFENNSIFKYVTYNKGEKEGKAIYFNLGAGYISNIVERDADNFINVAARSIFSINNMYPWKPVYPHDTVNDEVYLTAIDNKLIIYNDSTSNLQKQLFLNKNKSHEYSINPKSIRILSVEEEEHGG